MIIYCIEDINDNKYIGSTKRQLDTRLTEHRYKQRNQLGTTSQQLNLYNCIIYVLEECDESERSEREKYYIQNTDCVNQIRFVGSENHNKNQRKYYHKNIEKMREYYRKYYHKNSKK